MLFSEGTLRPFFKVRKHIYLVQTAFQYPPKTSSLFRSAFLFQFHSVRIASERPCSRGGISALASFHLLGLVYIHFEDGLVSNSKDSMPRQKAKERLNLPEKSPP